MLIGKLNMWLLAWGALISAAVSCRSVSDGVSTRNAVSLKGDSVSIQPTSSDTTYNEYVMVLIAADWCGACRQPSLPLALDKLRLSLGRAAKEKGSSLRTVAVILDPDAKKAYEHSRRYGAFDELILGGQWGGHGAVEYIWRDLAGPASVPQIVVLRRRVTIGANGYVYGRDELVDRLIGNEEIGKGRIHRLGSRSGL